MSTKIDQSGVLEPAFRLDSVSPVPDPMGGNAPWFRYVISQGLNPENAITGTKSGARDDVHDQLHAMVEKLNERFGKLQSKRK